MRSLFTLLSLSGLVSAGSILIPVVAGDFAERDLTDPLDPMALIPERSADRPVPATAVVESSDDRLDDNDTPTVRATLEPSDIEPRPVPVVAPPKPKVRTVPDVVRVITGEASWYGPGFYGNRTASGEVYRPGTMTAAHRSLPFGTKVRVTNLWNGRSAVIRINDRGPFVHHRVIDLGHGAASSLGLTASGIAQVKLEVLR